MCEAGQLAANHIGGRGSLKHRPSSSICRSEQITYLMQQLEASDQAYENLRCQFQSLISLVMKYLPPDAQTRLQQFQSSPILSQQQLIPVQEPQSQQQEQDP